MSSSQTLQSPPQENACPECGNEVSFDEKRGETTCSSCGLVVEENKLDQGPEWRRFQTDNDESLVRTGAPNTELRHDKGIGFTKISKGETDANGHQIDLKKRRKFSRLRRYHKQSQTRNTKERNLRNGITEILRMGSALGLSEDVKETASMIFRRASQKDMIAGRSVEAIASSALYASIRLTGLPIRIPEVAQVSRVEKQQIKHGYSILNKELKLGVSPRSPEDYLPKIISELNDPDMEQTNGKASYADESKLELKARELIDIARKKNLFSGKRPIGIAGAAVYAADQLLSDDPEAGESVTLNQHAIGEITDKSPVTIRTRYQELINAYNEHAE